MRRGGLRRNHLSGRRAALDVRQKAELLVGLIEVLEVRSPGSVELSLSLLLLLLANVEEEAGLLLTKLLSHTPKLSLLHAEPCTGLPGLDSELAVLRTEPTNALSDLSRLLRALKPQAACRFGACHTHLGLALPKLAVLLSQLPGKLLCADTHLSGPLGNVCLSGSASKTHLPGLLSKLPGKLGGVHAGAGGKLLDVHASLGLSLSIGCGELLSRKPRPGRHFSTGKAKLASL